MKKLFSLFMVLVFFAGPAHAENGEVEVIKSQMQAMQEQFDAMKTNYEHMMAQMQERIEDLENEKKITSDSSPVQNLVKSMNPDISVMGDFTYKSTDEEVEGDNDFSFRELELAISGNVDNYARGDIFIALENEDGETEIALEEGYLTLLQTPVKDLQAKFGKFRPDFGKANRMHLHNMPWVDYPKVVVNYLGEEGFSNAGAGISYLIPNPLDFYSEVSLQAFNNNDTEVFGADTEGDAAYLAHLKNFFEINDQITFELGASHMFGDNEGDGSTRTNVSGADVTLKWKSPNPGSYQEITWLSEALFSNKESFNDDGEEIDIDSWGMYSSLEYQFAKRWKTFGRYDYTETPDDNNIQTNSYSAGLTFMQSEYVFWRLQLTHDDNSNDVPDSDTLWLQLDFGLGPHRAHSY